MGTSNEAAFRISLEGDAGGVGALFAAFKRQLKSDASEIERTTSSITLFKGLDADLKKAATAVDDTRARLGKLRDAALQVQGAGELIGKDLANGIRAAEVAAASAQKEFVKQSIAVDKLAASLKVAGVNVANLAAEELRLAAAAKQASAAAVEQQSKMALGFKTLRDIGPEVNRLTAAYTSLRDSGKLTFGELSILQARYQQQVGALRAEVAGVGAAFSEVRGSLLAFTAAFAGIIAAGAKSAENFREFSTQVAAIGTIAGVTDERLAELGNGVRALSREMGVDAVNSARALYDIIGSGISADNALSVLAESTKAARAGLTDVSTAAGIGVGILNGYGLQVQDLRRVYDVLFQTVKDGVVTFPELAKNIGVVIPIARQANIPLEELTAAFVVLTRQKIDAPEAATAISRAIQELSAPAPEAAERMRALGIEFKGLLGTIEQFASKNLSPAQLQALIPEARAIRAVASLSQNFKLLKDQVELASRASGDMQAAYERMAATPQARVDRFNASIKDLSFSLGEFVTNATGFIETLTRIANGFNGMGDKAKQTSFQILAIATAIVTLTTAIRLLAVPLNLLGGALAAAGTGTLSLASGFTVATAAATLLQAGIAAFLGFRLGELLYEWSAAVRVVGDVLGLLAATISNTVVGAVKALWYALTLNAQGLRETWEQFKNNNSIIAEQYVATLTGANERTRALTDAQKRLGEQLAATAKAAGTAAGELDTAVSALLSKLDVQAKAVDRALTQTQSRLTSLVASIQKSVADSTSAAQQAIANLAATTATRLAALTTIDVQKVRETVEIQRTAATERLAIVNKFATDVIAAFNAEAAARVSIAQKSGEDLKRLDLDLAQQKKGILQGIVDAYRAHVDQLLALERQHLENVRQIEEQRRGINQSVEEKIREIRRGTLDEYQKYADRVREIDEFISKSRKALADGDNKLAEEFANKAIAAAGSVANAVKEGEREVVSASAAQSTAIGRIQTAQDLLNASLKQRADAEREGAAAAKAALEEALPLLEQYKTKLDEISAIAKQGVELKITADVAAVQESVAKLEKELAERGVVMKLIADLTAANADIQKVKADLEKGIPVPLTAQTEKLDAAIRAIREARPELTVETTAAQSKVDALRAAVVALEAVKVNVQATVESNVGEVQAQIDALKEPTFSTHTVTVVTVQGNAAGGLVGEVVPGFARGGRVRRFAGGGAVFRSPTWAKVPGVGNGDTVPAALQAGSFVVRKSAARYYGDRLMSALARGVGVVRRFARGGPVQAFAGGGGVLTPGKGAGAILIGKGSGALGGLSKEFDEVLEKLFQLREEARTLPHSSTGLDIAEWAARIITKFPLFDDKRKEKIRKVIDEGFEGWLSGIETARQFRVPAVMEFGIASLAFRRGGGGPGLGAGSDTVPAMLTPGEFVVRKPAVDRFGAGLLHAINNMRISRESLAGMLSPPARVQRFAGGGQVGGMPAGGGPVTMGGSAPVVNFYLDGSDLLSEAQIRRKVIPVLNDVLKSSR